MDEIFREYMRHGSYFNVSKSLEKKILTSLEETDNLLDRLDREVKDFLVKNPPPVKPLQADDSTPKS